MKKWILNRGNNPLPDFHKWRVEDGAESHPLIGEYCEYGALILPQAGTFRDELDRLEDSINAGKYNHGELDEHFWEANHIPSIVRSFYKIRPLVFSVWVSEKVVQCYSEARLAYGFGCYYAVAFSIRGFLEFAINDVAVRIDLPGRAEMNWTKKMNSLTNRHQQENTVLYNAWQELNQVVHGADPSDSGSAIDANIALEIIHKVRSAVEMLYEMHRAKLSGEHQLETLDEAESQ